jgi:hypothetical protein
MNSASWDVGKLVCEERGTAGQNKAQGTQRTSLIDSSEPLGLARNKAASQVNRFARFSPALRPTL